MSETVTDYSDTPSVADYGLPDTPDPDQADYLDVLEQSVRDVTTKPLSRRGLLGGMVALAGLQAIGKLETTIEDQHWPSAGTTIVMPGYADTAAPLASAALSSSGFNGTHGPTILESLVRAEVYPHSFPNGYYQFGSDFNPSAIGNCTRSFADQLRPRHLDIHGVSEGMLIALGGALQARRKLRLVTANDSPFDADDVRDSAIVKIMAFAQEHDIYDGDMLGSALTFAYHDARLKGFGHPLEHLKTGIESMWQAKKPSFLAAQAAYINQADIAKKQSMYRDMIGPWTHFVFLKTMHSATDTVVDDYQAAGKWLPWFAELGAKTTLVEVPVEGHAHITSSINHGAHILRALAGEDYSQDDAASKNLVALVQDGRLPRRNRPHVRLQAKEPPAAA